jgi:hypothetical protein
MEPVIKEYLGQIKIGRKQSYKNLALFPLLSEYEAALDYLTLDEAFAGGLIEVGEIDPGGSVPEIKVLNKAAKRVLILDGEELVGAKQNRIVNTTIVVEALSKTVIPVSCVEQGRWDYRGARFRSEGRVMSAELRSMKAGQVHESVRAGGEFRSDQGALWDGIEEKAARMKAFCPSGAMSSIFEKETPTLREYVSRFRPVHMQIGAVLMVNGRTAGLDSFAGPGAYSKYFKKLLESYALDAIDRFEPKKEHKVHRGDVTAFLRSAVAAGVESRPSVALGTDCRIISDKLNGFALALDGKVLHLAMFGKNGSGNGGSGNGSRMQRASARRRRNRYEEQKE